MKSLSEWSSESLEWRQTKGGQRYWELFEGDERIATLDFPKIFDSLATLRTPEGAWQMRRKGVFNNDVLIFEPNNPEPVAVYHPNWALRKGVVEMVNGREYEFEVMNFWSTRYEIRDKMTGMVLLHYSSGLAHGKFWDIFKTQATMEVHSKMVTGADLALLSGLGFYLIQLIREQAAAATSATTAATA